jgi:hypothetical protein
MAKFTQVSPEDFPNLRDARRGRVSYPILKGFLETGYPLAKLDREGITRPVQSLTVSLSMYAKSHSMPIKILTRGGEIYMLRLDLDDSGKIDPNWSPDGEEEPPVNLEEIDADTVKARRA